MENSDSGPLQRILVALDGSTAARAALRWAVGILGARGEIVLLEVTPPAENVRSVLGEEVATAGQVQEGYTDTAMARLADAASSVPDGVRTQTLVETGEPAEEILRAAGREDVDLIALTVTGSGAWGPFALKPVMEQVARSGGRPVLVVPVDSRAGDVTDILVPIDGSEAALTALPIAAALGAALGAEIRIVQAVSFDGPQPTSAAMGIAHPDVIAREFRGAPREDAEAAVAAAVARLRDLGATARGTVLEGNPVATVVAAAEQAGGRALVVVTRRGTSTASPTSGDETDVPTTDRVSWTVGGVAAALLRARTVPVVIVPGI